MATAVQSVEATCLTSRPAAEAYLGGVCFKLGPPQLIGAELEWLTAQLPEHVRPDLAALAEALGPHTPRTIDPSSPAQPLPGGSAVTVEPGGQIELSSAPYHSARELCDYLVADQEVLAGLLSSRSILMASEAADTRRPAQRLLQSPRYCAMESRFAGIGPFGKLMMCNTAATQVSVDAGADPAAVERRWNLLHAIGPALIAAFACSPRLYGVPDGQWASQRMRTWLELDSPRTTGTPHAADYAGWVLDVPLLCIRNEGTDWTAPDGVTFADWADGALDGVIERPTAADLDYHLTTLFPPVRAAGHLEVRYLDAQPGDQWRVPVAAIDALLSGPGAMAEALAAALPTSERWRDAAEFGLADLELRAAATALLSLAASYSPDPEFVRLLDTAAERCCRGQAPSEDR
ncbi:MULTISPECIES: ergothioneine biosynthesis glutamate--cysteine ligase EgtA [unclassified Rhodococcus (in: high G+C Gram-positive bacteria)]|uniref:ergothioneine biosynthesis glutamate--cysteine ligase EgtA n=1 Tax=unclassified Rhodococcus (in: high G+C Gram-positive bacteria) TaxID=192944 RepID=UPI0016399561|nr:MULTISPECIES: ergothioneine biosynthesis glutamate--cysteine ligase EgtA [unclassified Rhodococcus (in: high G+C Gram-positive bacteria)]MBC2642953.1 ergothioneine biosynthesis glutamate--cysteine ligase EgtA [Rhodococcus sp. 3A]MBC2892305.1 ergothioneine biosynthesis glutamate--cysteine ligase EgtA [Rhodococcus sp. 4CII]